MLEELLTQIRRFGNTKKILTVIPLLHLEGQDLLLGTEKENEAKRAH